MGSSGSFTEANCQCEQCTNKDDSRFTTEYWPDLIKKWVFRQDSNVSFSWSNSKNCGKASKTSGFFGRENSGAVPLRGEAIEYRKEEVGYGQLFPGIFLRVYKGNMGHLSKKKTLFLGKLSKISVKMASESGLHEISSVKLRRPPIHVVDRNTGNKC